MIYMSNKILNTRCLCAETFAVESSHSETYSLIKPRGVIKKKLIKSILTPLSDGFSRCGINSIAFNQRISNSIFVKVPVIFIVVSMILVTCSCRRNESDDSSMTDSILKGYMNSLCSFNIDAMNENNLSKISEYSDSEGIKASCKVIAEKINWSVENVNINGSTAIAQVKITVPNDIEGICSAALNDAMMQMEQNTDKTFDALIRDAIKKYADSAETQEISAEVSMSKVGNKWYISQSTDTAAIISDIRTPVAAIYSIAGQ